ncbi:MAG: hypothetical protein HQK52_19605 [Oligoflexia bacterium]|nr:hypothetical protein [Oligoflexia bacterium]
MRLLLSLALLFSLASCGSLTKKEVIEVKVPVIQPIPEPPKIERPSLEINFITDEDLKNQNLDKIVKSMEITIQQLLDYSRKLEKALDAYRLLPPT